jgi:hypothetical protein
MTPLPDRASGGAAERIGARLGLAGRSPVLATTILIVGLGLLGADLFGLVHVVGGSLHGNDRAASFGVELSAVTTACLGGLIWALRRTAIRR